MVMAELIDGPKDGVRMDVHGWEIVFPVREPARVTFGEPESLSYNRTKLAVYQGPLRNPDKAHVAYRFVGYR